MKINMTTAFVAGFVAVSTIAVLAFPEIRQGVFSQASAQTVLPAQAGDAPATATHQTAGTASTQLVNDGNATANATANTGDANSNRRSGRTTARSAGNRNAGRNATNSRRSTRRTAERRRSQQRTTYRRRSQRRYCNTRG